MKTIMLLTVFLLVASAFGQHAEVRYMIGDVRFKETPRQGEWDRLKMDNRLVEKSVVRTWSESRCELNLPDGSMVKVEENSMLQLSFLPGSGKRDTDLFALLGRFYFNVKKRLSGRFRIKSPASVASIRGTEFMLINESSSSELLVKSGEVVFSDKNERNQVVVPAGMKSRIDKSGIPSQPESLTAEEAAMLASQGGNTVETLVKPTSTPPAQYSGVANGHSQPKAEYTPPKPQPQQFTPGKKKGGWGMGLNIGAVTIDNQIYNQIGLRPEFSIGKFGMALDLTIYIDEDGNIREDNWDSFNDIIEKIYYIRWAEKGDPFYVKVGSLDNYTLGYGILMRYYSNAIEYPTVIRTGMELGFQTEKFGMDVMVNHFKELGTPGGVFAGRMSYKLIGDLELGISAAYDRNQYAALDDQDDDGVPDALDDFPDDKNFAVDTDGDGVPDETDPDRDGNGYTDNTQEPGIPNNDPDSTILKPEPFNVKSAGRLEQLAYAVDLGYPVIDKEYLQLTLYAQGAQFQDGGWGIAAPGFLAKFAFINFYGEYRIFDEMFIPEYWNTTYELERAVFVQDSAGALQPVTKRELLESIDDRLKGFVVGADFNLWDVAIFGAEYQNMSNSDLDFKTFRANLDLNTSFVPKIQYAGAYYYQQNADELFKKQEGTILGYRVGYEITDGAALVFEYRQTYRDINGDGDIKGSDETVTTTNISTVFTF